LGGEVKNILVFLMMTRGARNAQATTLIMIMSMNKHANETTAMSNRGTSLSNGENAQDSIETKNNDQKEAEAQKNKFERLSRYPVK
jgi:hypothetical protein